MGARASHADGVGTTGPVVEGGALPCGALGGDHDACLLDPGPGRAVANPPTHGSLRRGSRGDGSVRVVGLLGGAGSGDELARLREPAGRHRTPSASRGPARRRRASRSACPPSARSPCRRASRRGTCRSTPPTVHVEALRRAVQHPISSRALARQEPSVAASGAGGLTVGEGQLQRVGNEAGAPAGETGRDLTARRRPPEHHVRAALRRDPEGVTLGVTRDGGHREVVALFELQRERGAPGSRAFVRGGRARGERSAARCPPRRVSRAAASGTRPASRRCCAPGRPANIGPPANTPGQSTRRRRRQRSRGRRYQDVEQWRA